MKDFREIIDGIGVDALARWLSVKPKHVRTMRDRNSIPQDYWPALIENCPKHLRREVSFEKLYAMRQERFATDAKDGVAA